MAYVLPSEQLVGIISRRTRRFWGYAIPFDAILVPVKECGQC